MSYKFEKIINQKLKEKEEKDKSQEETTENDKSKNTNEKSFSNTEKNEKPMTTNEAIKKAQDVVKDYEEGDYFDAPTSLNLEKIEVPNKTKEEISNQAKNEVSEKYKTSREKSNDNFQSKIDEILNNNKSLQTKNQENQDKINSYYDSSKKETENQALRRGLARSSIVIGELASIEGSRANELSKLLSQYQTSLDENEKKIQDFQAQKEKAIEELNIKEALEIEEKISSLTDEFEKQKKEAIEFNNNIEKLEAEYQIKYQKEKQDYQHEALKIDSTYGTDYLKEQMKQKQYDILESYLDTLEPSYAMNLLLTNKEFKNILQERFHSLYRHISDKL